MKTVIEMAREAGFEIDVWEDMNTYKAHGMSEELERFAALVREDEARGWRESNKRDYEHWKWAAEQNHSGEATDMVQEPLAIGAYEVVNEAGNEWSLVYPQAVHKYKMIPENRITQTFYTAPPKRA